MNSRLADSLLKGTQPDLNMSVLGRRFFSVMIGIAMILPVFSCRVDEESESKPNSKPTTANSQITPDQGHFNLVTPASPLQTISGGVEVPKQLPLISFTLST